VSYILRLTRRLANAPPAGRLKAACDLVGHHLPTDVKTELVSTYECANLSSRFHQDTEFWQFLSFGHSREDGSR